LFTPATRKRARDEHKRAGHYLAAHDCYGFFSELDGLVETGPTLTNVNDFRIILLPAGLGAKP
jgi:hydroxypyruvate reductase